MRFGNCVAKYCFVHSLLLEVSLLLLLSASSSSPHWLHTPPQQRSCCLCCTTLSLYIENTELLHFYYFCSYSTEKNIKHILRAFIFCTVRQSAFVYGKISKRCKRARHPHSLDGRRISHSTVKWKFPPCANVAQKYIISWKNYTQRRVGSDVQHVSVVGGNLLTIVENSHRREDVLSDDNDMCKDEFLVGACGWKRFKSSIDRITHQLSRPGVNAPEFDNWQFERLNRLLVCLSFR